VRYLRYAIPVMSKNYLPRTGNFYGMAITPVTMGATWVEGEMMCTDYGQFKRRGLVRHAKTKELVRVQCDIPDTFFSIPATTTTEHGYVTGNDDTKEFEFRPHTEQKQTPAEYRKKVRRAYK